MEPQIRTLSETNLIGKRIQMSFAKNKTRELWQAFMPKRAGIKNCISPNLYSVEIYNDTGFFKNFDPSKKFEKWAAVQVKDFSSLTNELEALKLPQGLYAMFTYKGKSSKARKMYQYIFENWIPSSGYQLDDRPHFALMGKKYKNEDPDSEEELWIPIKVV
jgi:AraC family transcriptional regulator